MSEAKEAYDKRRKVNAAIYPRILTYVLIAYIPFFLFLNLLRLWGFGFSLEDMGIFNQVINNTLEGNILQTSIKYPYLENSSWLGFHFIILPIFLSLPFYAIYPHPETLSIIHVMLVSLTSIIIYRTCTKIKLGEQWACFWAVIYLFNPVTLYHALFSFQETSFATPLIALAFYFLLARNLKGLWVICSLLILTKEHYGLTAGAFGLSWWLYHKNLKQGFILAAIGGISFLIVIFVIMPYFSPYNAHFMLAEQSDGGNYGRYQWLSKPASEVISLMPGKIINSQNLLYISGLLLPVLFLSLGACILLLPIAPDIIVTLLSDFAPQKAIFYYYSASLIAPLIFAAAVTLSKFKARRKIAGVIIILHIIYFFLVMIIPFSKISLLTNPGMDWSYGKLYQDAAATIPEDKWIVADDLSSMPLSSRRRIMSSLLGSYEKADYIFLRISPYRVAPVNDTANKGALLAAQDLLSHADWELEYWKYPYVIFKRGTVDKYDPAELQKVVEYYLDLKKTKTELQLTR